MHQILLEVRKVLRHWQALLLAAHKGLKLGRYFYGFTDNLLHCILELRRMGRFQEYARFAGFQSFGQGPEAAGSVRVEQVMVLLPHFPHGFGNLLVGISGTADFGRDGGMAASVKVEYTGKLLGRPHPSRWQW